MNQSKMTCGPLLAACLLSAIGISCWNLMPVTLGSAAKVYSLSDQQVGLLGSSLLSGWLLATVPAFFFMHKFDRRYVTAFGACLAAVVFAGSQFAETVSSLYITWAIAGFGMALVYCVSIQLIAELGKVESSFGYKVIAEVSSGAAFLYVFPAFIFPIWYYAGASYGLAAIYLFSLVVLYWVTPFPQTQNTSQVGEVGKASAQAWLALFGMLLFFCGITGLWTFMQLIGTDIGVTPVEMGIVLALLKLVGGIAGVSAVIAGAKYGVRWPHVVTLLAIVVSVILLNEADNTYTFAAGAWIWEFAFSLGFAYQAASLARLDSSGRLLLLIPSCIGLSGVAGPAIAGYLKSPDSYLNIYYFAVVLALIPSAIYLKLTPKSS